MDVPLTPELERIIQEKVASGLYASPGDLVREAIRLLIRYDRQLADLQRELDIGLDELNRGEVVEFDEAEVERIKAEGRARLKQQRRPA